MVKYNCWTLGGNGLYVILLTQVGSYSHIFHCILLFRLSSLPTYYIPKDGSFQTYRDYINQLPTVDHPEAFGQHTNADIASQIKETRYSPYKDYDMI